MRTTFSDGAHSIEEICAIARSRGFKALFINDHDRIDLSWGIPPFRRLFRYKKTYPSIATHGPKKFLAEIRRVARMYPDMILIPGCETSPYYYWTGSYFSGDLTAHDYDRRILVIHFDDPEDYRSLPTVGNEFSFRYSLRLLPGAILFFLPLAIGVWLVTGKGMGRTLGILIVVLSGLALADYNPFRGSLFTPYDGDRGVAPYQMVIDYVRERGGLSFWNYPEHRSGVRPHGPIHVSTPPYPDVLYSSDGYTGFAAIYGDSTRATEPGREWDRALNEYCLGRRLRAPWGISTADFHEDGRLGLKLGAFPTVFLVRHFTDKDVLEAMEKGRMYCSRGDGTDWPRLDRFDVETGDGTHAVMGETVVTSAFPRIRFTVNFPSKATLPMKLLLIRGGSLIRTFEGRPPLEVNYTDEAAPAGVTTYYRVMDEKKHLVSNPIFVRHEPKR
ncbi:MAG: hypothetical protein JXL84_26775 [Deltaproteobacteria bacterium]|nr:hypothetical protein [Deltaproteobacteria bacterium]